MFTGLVEFTADIVGRSSSGGAGKLRLNMHGAFSEPVEGESVAVNGCCLTLEGVDAAGVFCFHTLEETLQRTNLGVLPAGATVNVERALRLGDRLGGHLVSGHIDATGQVLALRQNAGGDWTLRISLPPALRSGLVEKGSIAIDGVSLTLTEIRDEDFSVCLIPVTLRETALRERRPGTTVNLESDLIGKYVARLLTPFRREPTVSMNTLRDAGFLE